MHNINKCQLLFLSISTFWKHFHRFHFSCFSPSLYEAIHVLWRWESRAREGEILAQGHIACLRQRQVSPGIF